MSGSGVLSPGRDHRGGFLTVNGNRWCAACGHEHGRSFLCPEYSPEIVELIKAEEELLDKVTELTLLPYGVPGDGISDLLTPFVARGLRKRGERG